MSVARKSREPFSDWSAARPPPGCRLPVYLRTLVRAPMSHRGLANGPIAGGFDNRTHQSCNASVRFSLAHLDCYSVHATLLGTMA